MENIIKQYVKEGINISNIRKIPKYQSPIIKYHHIDQHEN